MIELIPAIDIINGQCVRLTQGDYLQKKVYGDSPLEMAQRFEDLGFKRLHVVDLDGAKSKHVVNLAALEAISSNTSLTIDFGGGIKSDEDAARVFSAGAHMITVGSIAVNEPELLDSWIDKYSPYRIILGADVSNGKVAVNGWKEETTEELLPFLQRYINKGITQVLCTDISRDGMLSGPSIQLYQSVMQRFPQLHLIASGGISGNQDIADLDEAHIPAVVFGKAFYEGKLNVSQLQDFLSKNEE